jgi:hypothetical protein
MGCTQAIAQSSNPLLKVNIPPMETFPAPCKVSP